jgi:RHS repeat-associated protein
VSLKPASGIFFAQVQAHVGNFACKPRTASGFCRSAAQTRIGCVSFTDNAYGDLVSEYDGTHSYFHAYDGLGSSAALVDENANTTDKYLYRAFGFPSHTEGSNPSAYLYVGQQSYRWDSEISLYWLTERPYAPDIGAFIQPDRIGVEDSPNFNVYTYCANNPSNSIDPSGREAEPKVLRWNPWRRNWEETSRDLADMVNVAPNLNLPTINSEPRGQTFRQVQVPGTSGAKTSFYWDGGSQSWYEVPYLARERVGGPGLTAPPQPPAGGGWASYTLDYSVFRGVTPSNIDDLNETIPGWLDLYKDISSLIANGRFPGVPTDASEYTKGFIAGVYATTGKSVEIVKNILPILQQAGISLKKWGGEVTATGLDALARLQVGDSETVKRSAISFLRNQASSLEGGTRGAISHQVKLGDWGHGYQAGVAFASNAQLGLAARVIVAGAAAIGGVIKYRKAIWEYLKKVGGLKHITEEEAAKIAAKAEGKAEAEVLKILEQETKAAARGTRARDILAERLGPDPYLRHGVKGEAHHIFGVELFDTPLGQRLRDWEIDLNSPANGVWLPRKDYNGRIPSIHSGRPSGTYTDTVVRRLNAAATKGEALDILGKLKQELLNGTLKINNATGR